jgi:hypothetical protein
VIIFTTHGTDGAVGAVVVMMRLCGIKTFGTTLSFIRVSDSLEEHNFVVAPEAFQMEKLLEVSFRENHHNII